MSKISDELMAAARVVAPTIASFIPGGPLAVGAFTALSNLVLGKPDGTQAEVTQAIATMTPEQIATVRAGDQAYAAKMKELDITADQMAYADTASARSSNVAMAQAKSINEYAPLIISIIVLFLFTALVMGWAVRSDDAIIELVKVAVTLVLGFWLGSSRSSQSKDNTIADQSKMLGNSTPTVVPADASTKP